MTVFVGVVMVVITMTHLSTARAILAELPTLCTIPEAARGLRQSPRSIRRLLARGRLRAARIVPGGSSRVLIPRVELERLLEEALS